jgi:hypothetical protein
MSQIRMRDDLVEEEYTIPASYTFSDYDTQDEPIVYLSATDLDGAEQYDNGIDPDSHPFEVLKLKDGRVFYLMSIDLDY